jgi:Ion transport protein
MTTLVTASFFLVFKQPWIISVQLFNMYSFSSVTRYIIRSVTMHYDQLVVTGIFGLFIIFFFSLFSSEYFYADFAYYSDALLATYPKTGEIDDICDSFFSCFLHVTNLGVRESGIGEVLFLQGYTGSEWRFVWRFFLDFGFFILINVIILNIVFGIILDTFADLRDQQQAKGKYLLSKSSLMVF